jgi:hypothetical protein
VSRKAIGTPPLLSNGHRGPHFEEKRPGREADRSPPSSAEVKKLWSYTSTPPYVLIAWCLIKDRGNFTSFRNAGREFTAQHWLMVSWYLSGKDIEKGGHGAVWGTIPIFSCMGWGKSRETSRIIAGTLIENGTGHLPNTGQKHYRFSQLDWLLYIDTVGVQNALYHDDGEHYYCSWISINWKLI